jgi:hypothetical protein
VTWKSQYRELSAGGRRSIQVWETRVRASLAAPFLLIPVGKGHRLSSDSAVEARGRNDSGHGRFR